MHGLNSVKLIGVRLGNKQWAKLCEASIITGRQKSELVRKIMDHFFEEFQFGKPEGYWRDIPIVKQKVLDPNVKQPRSRVLNKTAGRTVKQNADLRNVRQKNSGKL